MKFPINLTKDELQKAYQEALKGAAETVEVKGFRKGKAPLDKVEAQLDQTKLYERAVSSLLPRKYIEHVKKNKLQPITEPKFTLKTKDAGTDKDWEFEVEVAEMPEVKLGDYKDTIKTAKTKGSIWVPGKDKKEEKTPEQQKQEQLTNALNALIENCEVEVPQMLIDEEVNRALSNLVSQAEQLGLTIDDYLRAQDTSKEQLREKYSKTATNNLKLEFITKDIAEQEKLGAKPEEVEEVIKQAKKENPKIDQKPFTNQEKMVIAHNLTRQKVVDYILGL